MSSSQYRLRLCNCCNLQRPECEYYKVVVGSNGLFNYCRQCTLGISKAKCMAPEHVAKMKANKAARRIATLERISADKKTCPNCGTLYSRTRDMRPSQWAKRILCRRSCPRPGHAVIASKERDTELGREYAKRYAKQERVRLRNNELRRIAYTQKRHVFVWRELLANTHRRRGTEKQYRTVEELGYSADELMVYIAAQFTEGMSWDNHGKWHLDHIKPLAVFAKETLPSVVNALSNLQPLWAFENLSKHDKYTGP